MSVKPLFLLCIVLMLFASRSSFAQIKIGISGGVNLNTISPQIADVTLDPFRTKYFASKSKKAFYGQVFTQHNINKYVDLLVFAGYSVRRFEKIDRFSGSGIIENWNRLFTIQQINLGTAFLYGLPLGTGKVSIGGGGNISYPLSGELKADGLFRLPGPSGSIVIKQDTTGQKFVPGALAMLRYDFNFGALLEIRYNYQFRTLPGVNLSIFELGAGYNFHFKKRRSDN